MSDPREPFLPHDLDLGDDDVIEAVEVVEHELAAPASRTSGYDGVGTRREARERALALLFEAEQRVLTPLAEILADLPMAPEPFALDLVQGVSEHQGELDELISRLSVSWSLERMPAIDRALLRIGAYELAYSDVPVGACISEAVELGKRYSTNDSHKFLNGMLASIAHEVRSDA